MTKAELMKHVGKKVTIYLKSSDLVLCGTLGFADEFSAKHNFHKPQYFYIDYIAFKVSHVRKVTESEE